MRDKITLKIVLGHFAFSLPATALIHFASGLPIWICFILSEIGMFVNGWLSVFGDIRSMRKADELMKSREQPTDQEPK